VVRETSNVKRELDHLIRQSFSGEGASLALKAHECAGQQFGAALAEYTRLAELLLRQRADYITVTAALLTPLRQRGCLTAQEIRSLFGKPVAGLVERVYAGRELRTDTPAHYGRDLRLFLRSISHDIRTVVLRLGIRLVELEKIAGQNGADHRDLARETLNLYVPLADRMGMGAIRTRMEDASFHVLEPEIYAALAQSVEPIRAEDKVALELVRGGVEQFLAEHGIKGTVYGRTKGLYSIYRKMNRLDSSLAEVMDRIGLRIVVPSVEECYAVLGLVHTHFRPIPGTFDDYIGLPKENGYQSLHTCVYPAPDISYKPVEFQIRTEAMHQEAEFGVAAHWRYKSSAEMEADSASKLRWLHNLLAQQDESIDQAEFIQSLHRQVSDDRLVVFDGAGRPIRLPAGATVRDLTGAEHRARVNGAPRQRDYPLQDGDTVEILHQQQTLTQNLDVV